MSHATPAGGQLDGRMAAVLAVEAALTGAQFVTETIRSLRSAECIDAREAGLAMELSQGTVRHLLTIEHVLGVVGRYDARRTAPLVRAILATAAYQVVWLDRVPPFAAVDQAVEIAHAQTSRRFGGLVNALLRRLTGALRERRVEWHTGATDCIRVDWTRACQFNRAVLPPSDDVPAHLGAATSNRPQRIVALLEHWGQATVAAIAWAQQARPVTVVQPNTLRISATELAERLRGELAGGRDYPSRERKLADSAPTARAAGSDAPPQGALPATNVDVTTDGDAVYISPGAPLADTPSFRAGLAYVQDSAAHVAARAVAATPGMRVLDLCAAPGGKSLALALQMHDQGTVWAYDADQHRLQQVGDNVARLGLTAIQVRADLPDVSAPTFDGALADVPCSNTGVLARRPEARLGFTPRKLASLVRVQGELIRLAAAHVRPGGCLVYSTCSLEREENETLVQAFLTDAPDWRLEREQTTLPAWGPQLSNWRDGGYFARLVRNT